MCIKSHSTRTVSLELSTVHSEITMVVGPFGIFCGIKKYVRVHAIVKRINERFFFYYLKEETSNLADAWLATSLRGTSTSITPYSASWFVNGVR